MILLIAALFLIAPAPAPAADQPQAPPQEPVCIQCHSQLPDKLGEPVNLWRKSIHADNGITCNGCHGGDPANAADAMNRARGFLGAPKETEIPAFCGRCHVGVLKDFLSSAHGRSLGKGGPTCVTCHSNHLVTRASINIINEKTCTQCHTFERARIIKAAMQGTETRIVAISSRIETLKEQGVDTERLEKGIFSVRNRFHTLFHDVDVARVTRESGQIGVELGKQEKELAAIDEIRRQRKIAGAIIVAALVVIAILFHTLRKTYD